jgi:NAD-dependent SIR2 family protein deacetylase
MHGSIQQMVCPLQDCRTVVDMDDSLMKQLLRREDIPCQRCPCTSIRCRIMLYDDKEGAATLPPQRLYLFKTTASGMPSIFGYRQSSWVSGGGLNGMQ